MSWIQSIKQNNRCSNSNKATWNMNKLQPPLNKIYAVNRGGRAFVIAAISFREQAADPGPVWQIATLLTIWLAENGHRAGFDGLACWVRLRRWSPSSATLALSTEPMLFNTEQRAGEEGRSAQGYWRLLKQQQWLLMWRTIDRDNIKVSSQPVDNTAAELEGALAAEGVSSPAPL